MAKKGTDQSRLNKSRKQPAIIMRREKPDGTEETLALSVRKGRAMKMAHRLAAHGWTVASRRPEPEAKRNAKISCTR